MWEFSEGVDGISTACQELGTPVVSGNVSLYNETDGVSIAPTPMIGMVGRIADVRQSPKAVAENPGKIYLLLPNDAKPTFGGSLAAKLLGFKPHAGEIPLLHWDTERESMSFLRQLVRSHAVSVARDVGDGGILTTACKMALPHGFGLGLDVTHLPGWAETDGDLSALGEIAGAYLVVLKEESAQQALQDSHSLRYNRLVEIGTILASRNVSWNGVSISVEDSIHAYKAALTR
jgi:phosphoribosylformylglycinamidine synthase